MSLPASLLSWPADALEEYEERAAIREYLGKMPRARAEEAAEEDVRRRWLLMGADGSRNRPLSLVK